MRAPRCTGSLASPLPVGRVGGRTAEQFSHACASAWPARRARHAVVPEVMGARYVSPGWPITTLFAASPPGGCHETAIVNQVIRYVVRRHAMAVGRRALIQAFGSMSMEENSERRIVLIGQGAGRRG